MKEALSILCLVLLVSVSEAAITKPHFGNFIKCLRSRTNPENPINDAIFTAENTTTFLSSYVSYTKNKRFTSPNYKTLMAIVTAKHVSHVQATVVCAKAGYSASRSFQTSVELMNTAKTMMQKVLTLGQ